MADLNSHLNKLSGEAERKEYVCQILYMLLKYMRKSEMFPDTLVAVQNALTHIASQEKKNART